MANTKKLIQAAAGAAGGEALNVEDVFSTYLYEGNDTSQTITNGIDLSGEGGMTWLKTRNDTHSHYLFDTERGAGYYLNSDTTGAQAYHATAWVTAFNSDGFDIGYSVAINDDVNDHASWTFRKAPKFFDVVTWTGTGSLQSISHNLGTTPAVIMVKCTTAASEWIVWHKDLSSTRGAIFLNQTYAEDVSDSYWGTNAQVSRTSTEFTVGTGSSSTYLTNASGKTFVAYLFAHNNNDGEFGPDADQDIIKCGSYTGTGSSGLEVDLGFEPQWLLIKNASRSISWHMTDVMRGLNHTGRAELYANTSGAEWTGSPAIVSPTPTGFVLGASNTYTNYSGETHIYIAIRRGPMAVPESATDVFAIDTRGSGTPDFTAGFSVDMSLFKDIANGTSSWTNSARLIQGTRLIPNTTAAEASSSFYDFDYQNGWGDSANAADTNDQTWMWRRAPNYFDVVAYTGNDTAGHTISHNLGVAPEMIWVKSRSSALSWFCYHSALTSNGAILLNSNGASFTGTTYWNDTDPTASDFTLGTSINVNGSAKTYIAYLFATLAGVSKVGSYTGNGTTLNIDCGFTTGARFVLIKGSSFTHDWHVFDTERGIVAGNDPFLELNTTNAENSSYDALDPYSAGFTINQTSVANLNANGASYIFYAIA